MVRLTFSIHFEMNKCTALWSKWISYVNKTTCKNFGLINKKNVVKNWFILQEVSIGYLISFWLYIFK